MDEMKKEQWQRAVESEQTKVWQFYSAKNRREKMAFDNVIRNIGIIPNCKLCYILYKYT